MLIKNVKIYTMDDSLGVIENGYLKAENGKITEIGSCDGEPSGGILFPGFIDGHTHLGLAEDSLDFEGDDTNETGDPVTPQLSAVDGLNPFDRCFEEARAGGITCVAVSPGSANPIGGRISVIKTAGHRADKMIVKSPVAIKFAMGENPKSVYHSKNQSPETRMATSAMIRENLIKARKYKEALERAQATYGTDDEVDEPDFDIKCDSLIPLLNGEVSAHFHAHRADDIFTAIRIAKEFSLKYSIVHCTEGHLVPDELAEEGITAFVGPNLCDRSKPELKNSTFKNPAILSKAGIKFGITTDHPVVPLQYLPLCAALACKNGMDRNEALRAITIYPAEILGVADRVGSIAVGKDADLVLFDRDPFDIMSEVKGVWIDGKAVL